MEKSQTEIRDKSTDVQTVENHFWFKQKFKVLSGDLFNVG